MHASQTGDALCLHVTLFGQATRYLVWFIYTLNKLGDAASAIKRWSSPWKR